MCQYEAIKHERPVVDAVEVAGAYLHRTVLAGVATASDSIVRQFSEPRRQPLDLLVEPVAQVEVDRANRQRLSWRITTVFHSCCTSCDGSSGRLGLGGLLRWPLVEEEGVETNGARERRWCMRRVETDREQQERQCGPGHHAGLVRRSVYYSTRSGSGAPAAAG